jgi:probable rRNA maturation factor
VSARTRWPLPRSEAERLARAVLRAEGVRRAMVSVAFVGRQGMRTLNRRHLGHDRPTDVLAFALTPGPGVRDSGHVVIGDVYVCGPVAAAQARRFETTAREELRRLVVHGVLHVLGHDHPAGSGRTASAMWRRQEALLARFGRRR